MNILINKENNQFIISILMDWDHKTNNSYVIVRWRLLGVCNQDIHPSRVKRGYRTGDWIGSHSFGWKARGMVTPMSLAWRSWRSETILLMSSCLGDAASHRSSDMNFSRRLLASSEFFNHMDSGNMVGPFFFNPFFKDLKSRMLGSLLFKSLLSICRAVMYTVSNLSFS